MDKRKEKKKLSCKAKMRSSSGAKGSDAKIPAKYLSYEKKISDTRTDVIEVRPVTSPVMDMQPSGNNDSVYLSGLIQVNITSTDAEDTFENLRPGGNSENFYHSPEPSVQSRGPSGRRMPQQQPQLHTLECQEQ